MKDYISQLIEIAKQLHYGRRVYNALRKAKTEIEAERIMIKARRAIT